MNEQYRKLTNEELRALYTQLGGKFHQPNDFQRQIIAHVKKYYPKTACSAIVTVNAEYNDAYYNHSVNFIVVYDDKGIEIAPNPETAKKSRQEWRNFNLPCEATEAMDEEITVFIGGVEIPDLYIKK